MHRSSPLPPLLTPEEAAAILRLSPRSLERWRYARNGPPYVRVMGSVRYEAASLEAWLRSRTSAKPCMCDAPDAAA